jgi:hypothetical protein
MAMNLIQDTIKLRLGTGISKAQLARDLGITDTTLQNVMNGRPCGPKVLKALGLRKVCQIVADESQASSYQPIKWPHKRQIERRAVKKAQKEKALPPAPESIPKIVAPVSGEPLKLTAECVQLALRYGLKPGPTWKAFLLEFPDSPTAEHWQAYCAAIGNQQPALAPKPDDGALGAPGELYAHLKPVVRGADMRPVDPFGVKFVDAK